MRSKTFQPLLVLCLFTPALGFAQEEAQPTVPPSASSISAAPESSAPVSASTASESAPPSPMSLLPSPVVKEGMVLQGAQGVPAAASTMTTPSSADTTAEVTVLGTRTEQKVDESPAAISVVTQRDLQKRYVPTFDEALRRETGVFVLKYRAPVDNHGMTVMRGLSGQNRTLLLVDGIPINGVFSGEIPWANLPVDTLSKIEIARGPFSALYGGNAMAGVVQATTMTPESSFARVRAGYGSYNTRSFGGTFGTRAFDDKLSLVVGVESYMSDGYEVQETRKSAGSTAASATDPVVTGWRASTDYNGNPQYVIGSPGKTGFNRSVGFVKIGYELSPRSSITVLGLASEWTAAYSGYHSYLRDASGNPVVDGRVNIDGHAITVSSNNFQSVDRKQRAHLVGLHYQAEINDNLDVDATLAVSRQWVRELEDRVVPTTVDASGYHWSPRKTTSLGFYGGTNINMKLGRQNTLTTGVNANIADGEQRVTLNVDRNDNTQIGTLADIGGKPFTGALYAQDEYRPVEWARIYGGLRLDTWHVFDGYRDLPTDSDPSAVHQSFEGRTSSALNPKVSVVLLPSKMTVLKASTGTAFRAPTLSELYGGSAHAGTQTFGNPSLNPERIFSVETGVVQHLPTHTRIELTLYYNRISDLISARTTSAAGDAVTTKLQDNAASARAYGLELGLRQRLVSWLSLFGNYTYTNAKYVSYPSNAAAEGKWLPNVPMHLYNVGLDAEVGRFQGVVTLEGASDSYARDDNKDTINGVPSGLDPYTTIDAKLSYRPIEHLKLSIVGTNLTDQRHYLNFGHMPGRSFYGEASFSL